MPAVYQLVGWYDDAEDQAFADAYGWDVTQWAGLSTPAAVRRLRMTTWLAGRTGEPTRT